MWSIIFDCSQTKFVAVKEVRCSILCNFSRNRLPSDLFNFWFSKTGSTEKDRRALTDWAVLLESYAFIVSKYAIPQKES